MAMSVKAMGQELRGDVEIEDGQVVFDVDLPPALGFLEPMIASAFKQGGQKLLAPPPGD